MSRSILAKRVLRSRSRTQEQLAWELLVAVRELYPEKIEELLEIGSALDVENLRQNFDFRFFKSLKPAFEPLDKHVTDWVRANGIECAAMTDAARRFVLGETGPREVTIALELGPHGEPVEPPSITAKPHEETKTEFLRRASSY